MYRKKLINRYWLIMVTELAVMFLVSVINIHHSLVIAFALAMVLFVFLTAEICFELKLFRVSTIVLGVLATVSGLVWLNPWVMHQYAYTTLLVSMSAFAAFHALAIVAIGKHVFLSARATLNMIIGSISIYLLIGLFFAFVYAVQAMALGGMFYIDGAPLNVEAQFGMVGFKEFVYFSFSTLATIGYGDIVPKDPLTRMTSYIEGILGSLYLAVVVAKLVGMYVTQGIRTPRPDAQ